MRRRSLAPVCQQTIREFGIGSLGNSGEIRQQPEATTLRMRQAGAPALVPYFDFREGPSPALKFWVAVEGRRLLASLLSRGSAILGFRAQPPYRAPFFADGKTAPCQPVSTYLFATLETRIKKGLAPGSSNGESVMSGCTHGIVYLESLSLGKSYAAYLWGIHHWTPQKRLAAWSVMKSVGNGNIDRAPIHNSRNGCLATDDYSRKDGTLIPSVILASHTSKENSAEHGARSDEQGDRQSDTIHPLFFL